MAIVIFISLKIREFVLALVAYFSMPEINPSSTACDLWRLITESMQDLHRLYCRPRKHELAFKCQSAWCGADLCIVYWPHEASFPVTAENLRSSHSIYIGLMIYVFPEIGRNSGSAPTYQTDSLHDLENSFSLCI